MSNGPLPKPTYLWTARHYGRQSRIFGQSTYILPHLIAAKLDTLIVNRGYKLPHINYTSLSIDTTENKFLLAGGANGDIFLADLCQLNDQKPEAIGFHYREHRSREGHRSYVHHGDWFKNDASSFVTGARDHTVKLWDTENLAVIETYTFEYDTEEISGVEWSAFQPHLIAVGLNSSVVKFVDPSIGATVQQIRWSSKHITAVKWYPKDKNMLFTGTKEGDYGIFDIRHTKIPLCELNRIDTTKHKSAISRAKFTPDGTKLVTLSAGGKMHVHYMENGEIIQTIHNFRSRIHKSANFDLCDESDSLIAFVPAGSEICMIPLDSLPDSTNNSSKIHRVPEKKLYSGFASAAVACVYRRKYHHVIGFGLDRNCQVYTPTFDIRADIDKPVDNALHRDAWSSDED